MFHMHSRDMNRQIAQLTDLSPPPSGAALQAVECLVTTRTVLTQALLSARLDLEQVANDSMPEPTDHRICFHNIDPEHRAIINSCANQLVELMDEMEALL